MIAEPALNVETGREPALSPPSAPRGRVATRRAYQHLGYPPPAGLGPSLFD